MPLVGNRYGKGRVRVMRAVRGDGPHAVSELDVAVMLEGAFAASYTDADNTDVVATDSIKNLVYVVAAEHPGASAEAFVAAIAARFLARYRQVSSVSVTARDARWIRLAGSAGPHPHAFLRDGNGVRVARADATRDATTLSSGVSGFSFLKSGGSGFRGFVRDEITTLPEVDDRLCGTSMDATWLWRAMPDDPARENDAVLATMLDVFADTFSASLQDSLYRMGEAVLRARPLVERLDLSCPNKHFIPVDLAKLGSGPGAGDVYVATDEPFGQIECSVARG